MAEPTELIIKALLTMLAFGVIVVGRIGRPNQRPMAQKVLLGVAALSVLAYVNFGAFSVSGFVHNGEMFHYFLGSKYFPELGYDGLYAASLLAQAEQEPGSPLPPLTRDLRTNEIVPTTSLMGQLREVRQHFSSQRWESFLADHGYFLDPRIPYGPARLRLDHGYNPSPAWTFAGRGLSSLMHATRQNLTMLGVLDLAILVAACVAVYRTFGPVAGGLSLILLGLGYPWRAVWVGGAMLRYDWLAAVLLSICSMKKERYSASGAFLAFAAAVRVFPALLLVGLSVRAVRDLLARDDTRWVKRFAGGFAVTILLCFIAGSLAGRGTQAWLEFAKNTAKHRATWSSNTLGLESALLYGSDTMTRNLPAGRPLHERWAIWQARMNARHDTLRPFYIALAGAFALLIAAASWSARKEDVLVLGCATVFAAVVLSCYYWVILITIPLRRVDWSALALLLVNIVMLGMGLFGAATEEIYLVVAWALTVFFVAWLLPDVRRTFRGEQSLVSSSDSRKDASKPKHHSKRRLRATGAAHAPRQPTMETAI